MVFFQGMLLLGYGYTHLLATTQSLRRQMALQAAVLALPFCVLPFALGDWELADPAANPVLPLLGTLAVMVGLPFFAVSTTAPLLQKWFVHTGDASAHDPYFLYAASNLGSIVGLLLYPFVVEPLWPVEPRSMQACRCRARAQIWTLGFAVFVGMVAVIGGIVTLKAGAPALPGVMPVLKASRAPASADLTVGRRLRWLALAAIPSSLMLGVTTHMTTDIAAVPFLWVLPLALYLLTFIVVFARWPFVWLNGPHRIMLYVQPCLVAMMLFLMIGRPTTPLWVNFVVHLAAFASTALVCHGALAEDRPGAGQLTEFYFWLALGGVAGGAFNAILAPIVFQFGVWEYPLAIVAACLMRSQPHTSAPRPTTRLGYALLFAVPLTLGAISFHLAYAAGDPANVAARWQRPLVLALPCVLLTTMIWRPICFAATLAALFISVGFTERINEPLVYEGAQLLRRKWRAFMRGSSTCPSAPGVDYPRSERTSIRMLVHGGVNHGGQIVAYIDECLANETPGVTQRKRSAPIMNFHESNGVAEVFHRLAWGRCRRPGANLGVSSSRLLPRRVAGGSGGCTSGADLSAACGTQSGTAIGRSVRAQRCILAAYAKPYQSGGLFRDRSARQELCRWCPGYVPCHAATGSAIEARFPDPVFSFVQDAQERSANVSILLGDGRFKLPREALPLIITSSASTFSARMPFRSTC